jgi:hypothetical protein
MLEWNRSANDDCGCPAGAPKNLMAKRNWPLPGSSCVTYTTKSKISGDIEVVAIIGARGAYSCRHCLVDLAMTLKPPALPLQPLLRPLQPLSLQALLQPLQPHLQLQAEVAESGTGNELVDVW